MASASNESPITADATSLADQDAPQFRWVVGPRRRAPPCWHHKSWDRRTSPFQGINDKIRTGLLSCRAVSTGVDQMV
jgi:hypothetical protein